MKNVLVLLHRDAGQEARLQAALDVTRAISGHLVCLDVIPDIIVYDQGMSTAPPVIIDETRQEAENRTRLQQRIEAEDVCWSWEERRGDYVSCVLDAAATADVIVLNRKFDTASRPDMRSVVTGVLAHSDALVLAVTEDCRGIDVAGPALVAWDGSDSAFTALRRAMPLLQLASTVTVFQSGAPSSEIPVAEAAVYLSRHGVDADVEIGEEGLDIASAICDAARRSRASYCVMGAYSHGRLRETLFGGVTHAMLAEATLPLLLAR